jgi:hypothetical protein
MKPPETAGTLVAPRKAMRATLVACVLRRAVLASLVSRTLVGCGGASSPEGSGTSGGPSGGGSGSPSAGSPAATGAATGSSTTGKATRGAASSGAVTSGVAQTGASTGASSGASGGPSIGGSTGSVANGFLDSGLPSACALTPGQMPSPLCGLWRPSLLGPGVDCLPIDGGPQPSCLALCGPGGVYCFPSDDSTGSHIACEYNIGCGPSSGTSGRRPEGLADARATGPDAVARFLAHTAYLEAASVDAFDRLALELQSHGSPKGPRAAARRAARDEMRHALVTKKLAERAGGHVPRVRLLRQQVRALEDIAIENAVEGCVRETFAAAVAMIQAERAADPQVRRAMKPIARDETRHAELSWAVARWIEPQLDREQRRRVRDAQEQAIAALVSDAAFEPDASLTERLGVPTASQARAVLTVLLASLWSEPMAA